MKNKQVTNIVMMIRPACFGYNAQTALDNMYQKNNIEISSSEIAKKALLEFDNFVDVLENAGINVIQFEDDLRSITPDAIFPNNWISTHQDGTICLFPMYAENRRIERRIDILSYFKNNFKVSNLFDKAEVYESNNKFLEGTGSIVLDRIHKVAYACISKRTDENLFYEWCEKMNFRGISFSSNDLGAPVYHTNVVMSVSENLVFICLDAIVNDNKKEQLLSSFNETNKGIVNISQYQMQHFLGNVLELKNNKNESFLVMSTTAFESLDNTQIDIINLKSQILHSSLNTIEYFGGGSARCMIAEVFLEPDFNPKLKLPIVS